MNSKVLFIHALSSLHVGTGQGVGIIDNPIVREKATNRPLVPGSAIKGVLADAYGDPKSDSRKKVFGPPTDEAGDNAGAALFSSNRLLLLPVRSLCGTFAWVTCPDVLRRFRRDDVAIAGLKDAPSVPILIDDEACLVADAKAGVLYTTDLVVLEDLDLNAQADDNTRQWATWLARHLFPGDKEWAAMLGARLCVVSDDIFDFLGETATEVNARIRLKDDSKTVAKGGLWYEESLPAETVLVGLVSAQVIEATKMSAAQVLEAVQSTMGAPVQIGGKASVGRGLCRLRLVGGEA